MADKTKIEWCDTTWNPVTGCKHGCEYCYARGIARRFAKDERYHAISDRENEKVIISGISCEHGVVHNPVCQKRLSPYPYGFDPTFHRYRLEEPEHWRKPRNIFVCSMADLFGEWVPDRWIEEVFAACAAAPQHNYMFLTKNHARYAQFAVKGMLPKEHWYGTTITGPVGRFFSEYGYNTFLSIEPLLKPFTEGHAINGWMAVLHIGWIIVGAQTGPGAKDHRPEPAWVRNICGMAGFGNKPVFMKDSLVPIIGEENMRRELPKGLVINDRWQA